MLTARESMNLPNSLTVVRIVMIPVFVGLLVYGEYGYGLGVLVLAGITDALDGIIARLANQRTQLGAILDPLADKLLLSTGFVTLAILHLIPLWAAIVIVSRDLILMTGTLLVHLTDVRVEIVPTLLGKSTTVFQLMYLILVVFFSWRVIELELLHPLLYASVFLTLCSGFHYLYRGFAHLGSSHA